MSLDDIINPAQISSLTALALAPGVLKTTMPLLVSSDDRNIIGPRASPRHRGDGRR